MTSDAKIGLLLGLVFIFIIAFVINGLPRFQNSVDSTAQAAEDIFVQPEPLGYNVRNSYANEEESYNNDVDIIPVPVNSYDNEVVFNSNPWGGNEHASVEDIVSTSYESEFENSNEFTPVADDELNDNENVRFVAVNSDENDRLRINLPSAAAQREVSLEGSNNSNNAGTNERPNTPFGGGNGFGGNGFGGGGFNRQNVAGGAGQWGARSGGFGGMPGTGGNTPSSDTATRENRPSGNTTARDNTTATRENPMLRTNMPNNMNRMNTPGGSTPSTPAVMNTGGNRPNIPVQRAQQNQTFKEVSYTIEKGDNNLAKIAKKFYGEEEGNRLVNINKIFDRNKDVMESPDKIFVGQKIVIPQPAPPISSNPANVLSGSMFQNVTNMGTPDRRTSNPRLDTGNWYVVKENDSLWKIAAQELGSGARFEEISKLNSDILTDKNKLKLGMKLRMPAK